MGGPFFFEWDDANVEHIARHGFIPEEIEEVFAGPFQLRKARHRRYLACGPTFDGRMTMAIFERSPRRRIRVVTARDMTTRERRHYRRNQHGN